jgi:hypothetical protein
MAVYGFYTVFTVFTVFTGIAVAGAFGFAGIALRLTKCHFSCYTPHASVIGILTRADRLSSLTQVSRAGALPARFVRWTRVCESETQSGKTPRYRN